MSEKEKYILSQIKAYKRKYIFSLVVKGLLISGSALLSIFLLFNYLEYSFHFGINFRTILFFSYVIAALGLLTYYVIIPAGKLLILDKAIDSELAAKNIGLYYPEISDRLLNIIQLRSVSEKGSLAYAGLAQKVEDIPPIRFSQAVDLRENKKILPWFLAPVAIFILFIMLKPEVITQGTKRITRFNNEFLPTAPFIFELQGGSVQAYRNEDVNIELKLKGDAIPDQAYIMVGSRKLKMNRKQGGLFEFTLKKIQSPLTFHFNAAGFTSENHSISLLNRPDLKTFNIRLDYPNYLQKEDEVLSNTGNINVPEGTQIEWQISAAHTDSVWFMFSNDQVKADHINEQLFNLSKQATNSENYQIHLKNTSAKNKDLLQYRLDVVKDQLPNIDNSVYQDTSLFSYITLGGNISDDHGLTRLSLFYSVDDGDYIEQPIKIDRSQANQRYFHQWTLDSVIGDNTNLEYYLQVWDNDAINGYKSVKTGLYNFRIPNKKELKENLSRAATQTENDIDKRLKEAQEIKDDLKEAENRIKGKKELNWQDEKQIKDLIKKREELNQAIDQLKEQNKLTQEKRNRLGNQNKRLQEKSESLQKLMDELLDDETKKLYDELKKLLEEKSKVEEIQDLIDQLNNKETNLEQELERTLELFKKMKLEHDLDMAIEDLKEQIAQQESLIEETEKANDQDGDKYSNLDDQEDKIESDNSNEKNNSNDNLSIKQDELQDSFKELEDKLENIKEQNQSLKNPESLPDTEDEQEVIKENQQNSKESLGQGDKGKAKESQQKAKEAMQQMADKMEQMQSSMEMQAMQENLDDLRSIVYNLIRLSFDQESLMEEFSAVKQSDPRFVELSQKQLKLMDDSEIVQDSLLSLANRVFQIASFVTREVTEMNDHMDRAVEHIRDRHKGQAVAEQQFAMTSMNNLALLLDDVLQQMQNAMADAQGKPNQKGNQKAPSLSELQKQLNGQIEDLKGSGKKGRQLSEELAELAAEQERIREALEEAQEKFGEGDGGQIPGKGATEKMEETEMDLVNKRITQETIERQKQILTRLLEAENAMREKELDEERKGETANNYEKAVPDTFEEYFRLKEKEIEYLKTIPPRLYPYYKDEVNEYFKRLDNQ